MRAETELKTCGTCGRRTMIHLLDDESLARAPYGDALTYCNLAVTEKHTTKHVQEGLLYSLSAAEVCDKCIHFARRRGDLRPRAPLTFALRQYGKRLCNHKHTTAAQARKCQAVAKSKKRRSVLTVSDGTMWIAVK